MSLSIPTQISTQAVLTAGKATFTLEGRDRRWTFRFDTIEADVPNKAPITFVKVLAGPDNTTDFSYLGVYRPTEGWVRLTAKSRLGEKAEAVRAIRWFVGKVFNGQEAEIAAKGFRILWASNCQRCGRTLTVPSSIDARFGPECAGKVG